MRTVWLNAWLYSREQALWRALISRVLDGARGFPTLDQAAQDRLTQLESRIYGAAAPAGGHLVLPAGAMAGLEGAALPPLTHEFCSRDGLSAMVEKTITYCQKQDCMADLLAEVKKANPRRYAQYEGDLSGKG